MKFFYLYIFSGQDNVMGLVASLRIGSAVCLIMPYIKHDHPLVIFVLKCYLFNFKLYKSQLNYLKMIKIMKIT